MSSTTGGGPAVEVACAALRRLQPREQYSAQDYMVCLSPGGHVLRRRVETGQEPQRAALQAVLEQAGLRGNAALPLAVHGRPPSVGIHTVTLLFAVPLATSEPESDSLAQFHSLAAAMDNPQIDHTDRVMLRAVDQWLRERHTLPFLDPTLLFLGGGEGGEGGVVRAIIENPVFSCRVQPPEDQLVISLNNPAFSTHSTLDLHATQA